MTCEDNVMFEVVAKEMKKITSEILQENSECTFVWKSDIMTDMTMTASKVFKACFGSEAGTRLGVTLYHATANIKKNM